MKTVKKPATSREYMDLDKKYGASNYSPLPVVLSRAEGCWCEDVEGKKYLDMLACYSALSQGHRHPKIIAAMVEQAGRITTTSRAFHNDVMGPFLEKLCKLTGKDCALLMNSGAEGVETAIKMARRWGYANKGIPDQKAEIIVCENNFHGRTTGVISFSTEEHYRRGFGPFMPGFKIVPFGDAKALRNAAGPNTCAMIIEPIQAEGGIVVPPAGYLTEARKICDEKKCLLIFDEIQTGLGRTGKLFAWQYEQGAKPDAMILGKALGGAVIPVSAVVANRDVLGVFDPGSHGSTFGGYPLACAVASASLDVIVDEDLSARAAEIGARFAAELKAMNSPIVIDVRGKGLLIGVELAHDAGGAHAACEKMLEQGVLCKETRDHVIRFAPPLVIQWKDVEWGLERIRKVLVPGRK